MDSGALASVIRADLGRTLGDPSKLPRALRTGRVTEQVPVEVAFDGHRFVTTAYLLQKSTEELILGADFFQRYKVALDFERERVVFTDPNALKFKLA